jgi:hypothetical protein
MISSLAFGQFVGRDNLSKSLYYMQKQELDSAKKYIDFAAEDVELKEKPKTWYYKGFIYKELYKKRDKANKISPYRATSVKAFKKVLNIDSKKEFTESSLKILKYLASTLYNDAARSLNPNDYMMAQENYKSYKEIILLIDPTINLNSQDIKFKLALASMFNKSAEGKSLDSALYEKIVKLYLEILEIDENNPGANYNLATLYYNEAAEMINNMDYDMDIEKLNEVQDYCIGIFLKGLPYMHKSYELNYKIDETLIGLSNIYYGLNDMEKSDFYKDKQQKREDRKRYEQLKKEIKELEEKGMKNSEEYKNHKTELQRLEKKFKDLEKGE